MRRFSRPYYLRVDFNKPLDSPTSLESRKLFWMKRNTTKKDDFHRANYSQNIVKKIPKLNFHICRAIIKSILGMKCWIGKIK